jgi:predicted N-acetyltransferase YhbS
MPDAVSDAEPDLVMPDGAVVRRARAADLPAMLELEADRESEDDAVDLRLVAETPGGLESMAVVELDRRIVSMATLLDETLALGGTPLPAGQIEMVATARDAEGRGYVRALMHHLHELSARRGHVVQVMIGIPNFYRQFGYAYSIPMHPWATVDPTVGKERLPADTALRLTTATEADLADCRALQDEAQCGYDAVMPHSDDCWTWLVRHASSSQVLARDADRRPVALARMYDDGDGSVDLGEIASSTPDATAALLSHAAEAAGRAGTLRVNVRPHVPALADHVRDVERADWYYVRIPDPAQLLRALSRVLLARLAAADRPHGEALISFFRRHVRLAWAAGTLRIESGGPLQAPVSAGGSGVPLDALGSMLFGGGAESLEDRFPDAYLGRQADLMAQLFPPQRADLLTFYLAS